LDTQFSNPGLKPEASSLFISYYAMQIHDCEAKEEYFGSENITEERRRNRVFQYFPFLRNRNLNNNETAIIFSLSPLICFLFLSLICIILTFQIYTEDIRDKK